MPVLKVRLRTEEKANALRRNGFIPAVVYGPTMENMSIAIAEKDLQALFAKITHSSRIDLAISDHEKEKKLDVFVKAIQYDPVTDEPIHVDFYHPDVGHPLKLHVPLKIVGEAPGVKAGGVLNVLFRTIQVEGLPKHIPHLVTADVSGLGLGEGLRVRDLDFGKVEPLLPPERVLVTVITPHRVEVTEGPLVPEEALEGKPTAEAAPATEESAKEEE